MAQGILFWKYVIYFYSGQFTGLNYNLSNFAQFDFLKIYENGLLQKTSNE